MKTCVLTVAAVLGLALTPSAAMAESRSVTVPTHDLDLSTKAGQAALDSRVATAVRQICNSSERGMVARKAEEACAANVRRDIAPQIDVAIADARQTRLAGLTIDPDA